MIFLLRQELKVLSDRNVDLDKEICKLKGGTGFAPARAVAPDVLHWFTDAGVPS